MTDQKKEKFNSLLETCEHLKNSGYKISKSKIYRDADEGKITREPDGTVKASAAREYAKTHLVSAEVVNTKKELKNLQAKKLKNAIRNQDIEYKKKKFELEKEIGKYLLRRDFEAEMAARAVILESGIKHRYNSHVSEWIALVGGKPERTADLLAALNQALDEQLNTYATTRVFQVIFEEE